MKISKNLTRLSTKGLYSVSWNISDSPVKEVIGISLFYPLLELLLEVESTTSRIPQKSLVMEILNEE